jgi:uncharacterized membrane protein
VDWRIYYQTNKGRLLAMGGILIVLGLFLYFARGIDARVLILPVVGIVLLIAGVIYKPREKKTEDVTRALETEKENEKTESKT